MGDSDYSRAERAIHFLERQGRWPEASFIEGSVHTESIAMEVAARMRGRITQPISMLLKGSEFQIRVWEALLAIPEGALLPIKDWRG